MITSCSGLLTWFKESQETLQQTTSLKQKLLLAAESQKIARDQELELEGIIDGLKQENRILKENEAKQLVTC